jgi:transposase
MLGLPSAVRVFLCRQPADMRKSFDGLCALVVGTLNDSPTSGHIFIFRNRRGDRLKAMWFDRDGLAIFYKRLEKGTFHFPSLCADAAPGGAAMHSARIEVSSRELAMILSGLEQKNLKQHARFSCNQ